MAGQRIAVTASRRYQALGIGGTRVIDQWDTLTALLAAELGPEHAALFAEPQRNAAQSEVDWYAPSGSGAVPVSTLPPDQRATVEAKARALEADIRGLAQRLAQKPDPTSKLLAAVLETALSLPEPREEHLYAAGGQPVLVAWGHVRAESAVTQETLTGRIATPAPPMAILPPPAALPLVAPQRSWLWLAWLAALLALLAALFLLWRDPFGLLNPQPVACQADLSGLAGLEALREESEREAVLRRELARITAEAGARRASCPPPPPPPPEPEPPPPPPPPPPPRRPPPPPPPPPPPQRPPQNDDLQRVEGAGGRSGNLQIILAWDTRSDLDLHVICPNGQRMFYANRRACGGELDVDANAGGPITTRPVENARWERPAPGRYRVEVHNYEGRGLDRVPYRVTIRRPGHPDQVINGVANAGERPHPVTTVDLTE